MNDTRSPFPAFTLFKPLIVIAMCQFGPGGGFIFTQIFDFNNPRQFLSSVFDKSAHNEDNHCTSHLCNGGIFLRRG